MDEDKDIVEVTPVEEVAGEDVVVPEEEVAGETEEDAPETLQVGA